MKIYTIVCAVAASLAVGTAAGRGQPWENPPKPAPPVSTLTNETRYLEWKWRTDVSDPSTGIGAAQMKKELEVLARERRGKEPWELTKARLFALGCDRAAIDVSPLCWFPAFALWTFHLNHPLWSILGERSRTIDREKMPEVAKEAAANWNNAYSTCLRDYAHCSPDWDAALPLGYAGLKARLHRHWKDTTYYQAKDLAVDAMIRMTGRLAAQGEKRLAEHPGDARLAKETASLKRLAAGRPETAYDVMMFIYLTWVICENYDNYQVRTLSNVDRILTPYYRADLAAGRTTEAEFREQLKHFWWQWGSIDNYWGQPVYIGGTKEDGTTEYNEVSKMILDVHDELAMPTPKLHLKIAKNTPDWVWARTLDMARRQRSVTFCGEEPISRVMQSFGYSAEQARTCIIWGCYEWGIRDSANDTGTAQVNMLKFIETTLRDAKDGKFKPADFAAFKEECLRRLEAKTADARRCSFETEKYLADVNPANVMSLFTTYSVENGIDSIAPGGTRSGNCSGIWLTGPGTFADALLAVKEIVYEGEGSGGSGRSGEGGMSLKELGEIMAKNWEGHEDLRLRMLRSPRKWGNNDPEANALCREAVKRATAQITGVPNSRGGKFKALGHTARMHIEFGKRTGATPDGRKAGEEMSKNLSPTMGMDTEGVTALVDTLANLDARDLPGDFPLDVALLPATASGEKGLAVMRTVVETYFANGGMVIQFNVHDPETLRDAQKHPEKYENLQVRVCGWNVRWNDIPKREQDKFILRAENIER